MSGYENVIFLKKGLKNAVRTQRREGLIVSEEKGRLHGSWSWAFRNSTNI